MKKAISGKMPRTRELIQCFSDTENFFRTEKEQATIEAMNNTQVYPELFRDESACFPGGTQTLLQVAEKTALEISQQFSLQQPAIMYFGNPEEPGGNVRQGSENVEACICRCSNLYPCLAQENVARYYYNYHKNRGAVSERVVAAENVCIFKDNGAFPSLLDEMEQYQVDIITTAALNLEDTESVQGQLISSITNCFSVAASLGIQLLIIAPVDYDTTLSQAQMIAQAFHTVLPEYRSVFRRVVFAVKANVQHECDIIGDVFRDVLQTDSPIGGLVGGDTVDLQFLAASQKKTEASVYDVHHQPVCFKHPDFTMWRKENPYYGKTFSVFGDICSMMSGYTPSHITPFYQGRSAENAGVQSWMEMWWGQVIDFFGGRLLAVNGLSEECLSEILPDNLDKNRLSLHTADAEPEVILIYQGVQDWIHGIPIEGHSDDGGFRSGYRCLLQSLSQRYPNAELWCCTLPRTMISGQPSFRFPYVCGGIHISEYNLAIQEEAERIGQKTVDLYHYSLSCDTVDGIHMNAAGMKSLAMMVCRGISSAEGASVWNCQSGMHEFVEILRTHDGQRVRNCKKCGVDERKAGEVLHELTAAGKTAAKEAWKENGAPTEAVSFIPSLEPQKPWKQMEHQPAEHDSLEDGPQERETAQGNNNSRYVLKIQNSNRTVVLGAMSDVRIGRDPSRCDITLQETVISRVHAILFLRDGVWNLCDNNSRNGTWVNGERLGPTRERKLQSGDVISLAGAESLCYIDESEPGEASWRQDALRGSDTLVLEINR